MSALRVRPTAMFDIKPLPFTPEEKAAMDRFGETMRSASPGTAIPVPKDVMAAMDRVMAPINKACHDELMAIRRRERRGWHTSRGLLFG